MRGRPCSCSTHFPQCDRARGQAYDGDTIRRLIEEQGAVPNIPPKANRRWKSCFSKVLYRGRNAIERMFCRLKDWRRIATRYDKLGKNFMTAICLAAAVTWWLCILA